MARRSGVLEYAVLGLLHEQPMHGYELRKQINALLGSFRAISYGSLYPCLKQLVDRGWIAEAGPADAGAPALTGRRARITYELTADGKEQFQGWVADAGPEAWDDEQFGVHFAFFSRTDQAVRMQILEGRRSRLQERLALLRGSLSRTSERVDQYTAELALHGLAGVEHEVRWLSELIDREQGANAAGTSPATDSRTDDTRSTRTDRKADRKAIRKTNKQPRGRRSPASAEIGRNSR